VEMQSLDRDAVSSHHLAVIQTDQRDRLRRALNTEQIGTGIHYPIPCHRQVAFITENTPNLPVAERAADRLLSLPMFPHLSDTQIGKIVEVIRGSLEAATHKTQDAVA
jgi:dTDP-4-amino-4,6-dideoxygalactose transaminase